MNNHNMKNYVFNLWLYFLYLDYINDNMQL